MSLDLMSPAEAWNAFNVPIAFGLFALYCLVEFLDSSLTLSITRHEAIRSANTTLILYFILGIEVLAFVNNYLYTIPIALGAWLGTYLLIEREKRLRPLEQSNKK